MSYSAVSLEAISTIISNQGLSVNANLANTLASYNTISTVSTTSAMFNTAAAVADSGQLTTALKALGNTAPVLFGVAPTTGVPNFTSNISTQASAPFSNGVAGFANVIMQVMPFVMQSFDIAGSSQLVKSKTYETSGPGYKGRTDLITAGIGPLASICSNAVAKFGTMYNIKNISGLADPYVFVDNLLSQGIGKVGGLSDKLSAVGLTSSNILTPPNNVEGSSPEVVVNILSQIKGQDVLDIISATGFSSVSSGAINSLADFLNLEKVVTKDISSVLITNDISTLDDFATFLNNKIGSGTFNSFSDLASTLSSLVVPALKVNTINPTASVVSANSLSALTSLTGIGSGPFNNPTLPDVLGCTSGIPYVSNFANIASTVNSIDVSTIVVNLGQLYTAINTYVGGGTFNSTTLAPVVTAVQNLGANATSLLTSTKLGTANSLYRTCYTHYVNEVSLISLANIIITNPGTTPSRLPDLARTITSIGTDPSQFGLVEFFTSVATLDANGDSVKSVIAENYNSQILQNKGIAFNNSVQPAVKLAQAQKFGIPVSTLQQLAK